MATGITCVRCSGVTAYQRVAAVARHLLLEAAKLRIEERELEAGGPIAIQRSGSGGSSGGRGVGGSGGSGSFHGSAGSGGSGVSITGGSPGRVGSSGGSGSTVGVGSSMAMCE